MRFPLSVISCETIILSLAQLCSNKEVHQYLVVVIHSYRKPAKKIRRASNARILSSANSLPEIIKPSGLTISRHKHGCFRNLQLNRTDPINRAMRIIELFRKEKSVSSFVVDSCDSTTCFTQTVSRLPCRAAFTLKAVVPFGTKSAKSIIASHGNNDSLLLEPHSQSIDFQTPERYFQAPRNHPRNQCSFPY